MKFKIHRGTADRVAANLTLSEWPGIVKLLPFPNNWAAMSIAKLKLGEYIQFHLLHNL